MNHSMQTADRGTHLKVVAVALVAGIAVAGLSLSFRANSDVAGQQTVAVIKAGKPMALTTAAAPLVR